MRRIVPCVLLLVASVPLGGAPAPLPKPERPDRRNDLERLQGEWVLVSYVKCDGQTSTFKDGEISLVITGRQATFKVDGREDKVGAYQLTLDTSSTPKKMDLIPQSDQFPDEIKKALTALCIYRIRRNALTMRMADVSLGRPTDFTSPSKLKSSDPDVLTFHRK